MKPKLLVSSSVINFREKAEKIWNLKRYKWPRDMFEPTVFFGMYHIGDYIHYWRHMGKRIIFWCGSDIVNLKNSMIPRHKLFKDSQNYVENEIERNELARMGMPSIIAPSFLEDVKDFPVSFKPSDKPQVYLTAHPTREGEYGVMLVAGIARRLPDITFHIYGINSANLYNIIFHGIVPPEQFNEEIKNYQCGLRPNEHDGFSEVLAKSALMGQYPISKIDYYYMDSYGSEGELVGLLKELKNKKQPNYIPSDYWRENVNNYPWTEE